MGFYATKYVCLRYLKMITKSGPFSLITKQYPFIILYLSLLSSKKHNTIFLDLDKDVITNYSLFLKTKSDAKMHI